MLPSMDRIVSLSKSIRVGPWESAECVLPRPSNSPELNRRRALVVLDKIDEILHWEQTKDMLGTDKSRGYCLEMICADFLAGAALETRRAEENVSDRPSFMRGCVGKYLNATVGVIRRADLQEIWTSIIYAGAAPLVTTPRPI